MGFRFQRRIKLSKYTTLVLSKTGASLSLGMRSLWLNFKNNKATFTIGIPGTGISYRVSRSISRNLFFIIFLITIFITTLIFIR